MNESTCEACGFNHQTDSCRDQKAIARWRERCAEHAEQSALGKRIEARKRREIEAPLRAVMLSDDELRAVLYMRERGDGAFDKIRAAHIDRIDEWTGRLSRLSPPSAPAQDGAERCEACRGTGRGTWNGDYAGFGRCGACNGTGKARR